MDKFDIQKLRDLPIESVAQRLGLTVTKHKSLCPFHQDSHPSLSFRASTNTFKCFVCGAHGGVIDLAMKILPSTGRSGGVSFIDTCEWLANEHNVILTEYKSATKTKETKAFDVTKFERFFLHPYINQSASKFLYDERKLDPRVVRWCRLTSWTDKEGNSWLQIPYYSIDGKLTGVQWRRLTPSNSLPRFRFPQGSQCHVYNLPVLKLLKPKEPLYITEGASDCWAILSSGHKAIAIPSATLLKPKDLEPLRGRELHIYPDNDEPGEKLYQSLIPVAISLGCCLIRHQLPEGCNDFSDYYRTKVKSNIWK